jgi:hypothetical protein
MINREIQDFGEDMSRDTIRCFLELQEREIDEDEKTQVEKYLNYKVNTNKE